MTPTKWFTLCLAASALLLSACENKVSYTEDVQPILFSACLSCHNKDSEGYLNSGFSLDSYEAVMKGTNFGAVIVPGSPESSSLYLVIAQKTAPEIHMPPHSDVALADGRGFPLSEDQVEVFRLWIEQGALNN